MRRLKSASIETALVLALALVAPSAGAQPARVKLDRAEVQNIVRRSYQYVAMYNVVNKTAMTPTSNPMGAGGWNRLKRTTAPFDHNVQAIARPNNDTFYQFVALDLRDEPVIVVVPPLDSKYASLETSAYDHYCDIPLSTRLGDFKKPVKLLFYAARTKGYKAGDKVEGIDRYIEMTGDFAAAFFRVMPHTNNAARFKRIITQIEGMKVMTLSEYKGAPSKPLSPVSFPAVGKTHADVFGNNLLEVMQFVFNHTTFDPRNELDHAVLAAYRPLGVEPGKAWDPAKVAPIDGSLFRQVSEEVATTSMAIYGDPARSAAYLPRLFRPKGKMDLDALVFQSVVGPMGNPAAEAMYPPVNTADGKPMNALHDYVIRMTRDELPPANAFWSLTVYDAKNGFFIPNTQKKYSVGENAGYRLNSQGGIEVYVAAAKPAGAPEENWLPISRKDEGIDVVLRVYAPDLGKMKTWKPPKAVLVR